MTPTDGGAEDLLRARAALLTPAPTGRRLAPAALRSALVDLHDLWLASRATALGVGPGTALVAVGSLGRRELAPGSGLDLLVLHDGARGAGLPTRVAEGLGALLRAARLGTTPPVRTVGEAVETSLGDLRTALGLLEVRAVVGDTALVDRLVTAVRRAWRAGAAARVGALVDLTHGRWARAGDVAHRLEPDLKNGRGGLRDLALLDALALAGTAERPPAEVRAARAVLLDLRTDLHRRAGRARDVLRIEDAPGPAPGGEAAADHHELARSLSRAARAVVSATEAALRAAHPVPARRGLTVLRRGPGRRAPLGEGVVEHGGEVTVSRAARVARDPVLVLRLAGAAARTGLPMAPGALRRLADAAPELREPWPEAARSELLALLGAGDGLVDVVEALDAAGLWGRLLPEWGAVRDLPPGGSRHRWTVDRHLVEVTARAATRTPRVSRPDLLLLGALVHDLGRGRDDDPAVVGAVLAGRIGRRLGLPSGDVGTLAAVVRHHRLLPGTARRRDPAEPATVRGVVDTLGGDLVLLELLHALAAADALGTGPGVWSPWLASLVDDLAGRCRSVMVAEGAQPASGPNSSASSARRRRP